MPLVEWDIYWRICCHDVEYKCCLSLPYLSFFENEMIRVFTISRTYRVSCASHGSCGRNIQTIV